ncbi:MAG TPA: hypothetical protein VM243_04160 [Phycisphaerae bacterium]|nr:hypothetical protein [Phycisphaerae bacterium]
MTGVRWQVVGMLGAALGAGAVLAAGGCGPWFARAGAGAPEAQAPGGGMRSLLADPAGDPSSNTIVVVQMQFDVLRVELPADQTHHSRKAWNYVNELHGDPTQTALLRRNGFRMGTASADSWPALRAMFEACEARVLRVPHVVQRGLPLTLQLDSIEEDQPIFLLTADNRMVGRTLERGEKYLHLDYALEVDGPQTVTIQVTPEIRLLGAEKYGRDEQGNVRRGRQYDGLAFRELSRTLRLAAGEFLVIGPDTSSGTGLTVGRCFLTHEREGRRYETVLCITPQPFRTEAAQQ